MSKYYDIYPNLLSLKYGRSVLRMKIMQKLFARPILQLDDEDQESMYRQAVLEQRYKYCDGWFFRTSEEVISPYIPLYRELFKPAFDTRSLEDKYLQAPDGEALIAVHIRRGDYKEWRDGIYYFEDDVYIDKVRQLLDQLGRPAKIIIFTNDSDLNLSAYQEAFKNVVKSDNPVAVDHYLMSKCDYILGPVSSFSLWASFIGQTMYCHFSTKDAKISLDQFRVSKGWYGPNITN